VAVKHVELSTTRCVNNSQWVKLAMADDSVVDDESKIVTRFLLNTCRLHEPTLHLVNAVDLCAGLAALHTCMSNEDSDEVDLIPLITGSVAEFYIQPMLSCVGDTDIMSHRSDSLAIPAGYLPPSQLPAEFHSRVNVCEIIDSEYPGYVYLVWSYLLRESIDGNRYDALRYSRRRYVVGLRDKPPNSDLIIHGPAMATTAYELSRDIVPCIRCLTWPTEAANWPIRQRNYGWPDSATVDRVVSNGCDLVQVAHHQCRQDEWMGEHQHRLSFSRAEIILLNSWMPVQQIIYHMLRVFAKTKILTDVTDNTGTTIPSNYHIKTLMLWSCELKQRSWWMDDLNVVRICAVLLHSLADRLKNTNYPHYFIKKCGLIDTALHRGIIASQLVSITESWLSTWFVNNYLRKCAQLCPGRVSRLFDDTSTTMKLQNAVSAVADWRVNTALYDLWEMWSLIAIVIPRVLYPDFSLNLRLCDYLTNELAKIDSCFNVYFTAVAFLHVADITSRNGLNDELTDVLATTVKQFIGKQHYSNKFSSILSLSQAANLMKVVVNNSRSTVQLIEIELSKTYLHRALRCKDSDSDSIYCLANVYLAVLYYTTGHYQTAIDRCTLVMRSQDHSQCSSHVVQGELLPKIDDNVDTVLGLAVFYQYVRTTALFQQQQTQYVSVFTTELFAYYLHMRCLSVVKCRQRLENYNLTTKQPFIVDVLLQKSAMESTGQKFCYNPLREQRCEFIANVTELDTSELVGLLQQSAIEHLTTYRQLEAQKFGSVYTIVTTDFEALYAYKRGEYQQCLRLSKQNVHALLYAVHMTGISTYREFIQLMDDDIVSLTALTLIVDPKCKLDKRCLLISHLIMSLYLMTQCQLKLHHPVTSLAQTLNYTRLAQLRCPVARTLDHLTLKLTERKIVIYLALTMFC